MNNQDRLAHDWASLGVAFNTGEGIYKNASPEQTIINTIKSGEFPADKKIFGLMLLWMEEYHEFIHVEQLKSLCKNLSPFELAILAALSKKILNHGDLRFKAIITYSKKKFGKHTPHFKEGDDKLLLSLKGFDEDFNEFNIKVVPLKRDEKKKLLKREHILKNNVWLKNRLLFGANLRADFITVFTLGLAQNAYQAAKFLNCSMNASYRNWRDIVEARGIGII
jgi:hypothetical protein